MIKKLFFLFSLFNVVLASEQSSLPKKTQEQKTLKTLITVTYSPTNQYFLSLKSIIPIKGHEDFFTEACSKILQITDATFHPTKEKPITWEYYSKDDIRPGNDQARLAQHMWFNKKTNN